MSKLTFGYVKKIIESVEGYKLLSDEYVNSSTKLKVKHECGHEYTVKFNNFQQGSRCPKCSIKQAADKKRFSFKYVKNEIEKVKGYKLLSDEYVNALTKLKIKHEKCGHEYEVTFNNFQTGYRCPKCSTKQRADKKRFSFGYIKNEIEKVEGYKLLSNEYVGALNKLKVKHDIEECGFEYEVKFNGFQQGYRCPKCAREQTTSKGEQQLKDFVTLGGYPFSPNDRSVIYNPNTGVPLEFDLWFEKLKKVIEYNGFYHSYPEVKERDRIKREQCEKLGIQLLIIEEKDWYKNKDKCKKIITQFLNS